MLIYIEDLQGIQVGDFECDTQCPYNFPLDDCNSSRNGKPSRKKQIVDQLWNLWRFLSIFVGIMKRPTHYVRRIIYCTYPIAIPCNPPAHKTVEPIASKSWLSIYNPGVISLDPICMSSSTDMRIFPIKRKLPGLFPASASFALISSS